MSFGFSVGDFIAFGKLVNDITNCLQSVRGPKSEYQELLRELKTLLVVLQHLDKLHSKISTPAKIDSIKYAALSCRYPLEEFLAKIQHFDASLGVQGRASTFKSTRNKVRWTFGHKDEVSRLRHYLNIHIDTINMLLT